MARSASLNSSPISAWIRLGRRCLEPATKRASSRTGFQAAPTAAPHSDNQGGDHVPSNDSHDQLIEKWLTLYNTDTCRTVHEHSSEDVTAEVPGFIAVHGRQRFKDAEAAVTAATPHRKATITRTIKLKDMIALDGLLSWTDKKTGTSKEANWCALFDIRDGLICHDRTYVGDIWSWRGISDALAVTQKHESQR
ncbi:nuclear transport factor 2 family protein [Streptomyces sp. NPDC101150]|uniref:nuclear transport factor 2 family protein n=1 Tax=Streptomyces sp. NPDC101150 TaxID=3366114 RepID=UPI0038158ED5